MDNATDDPKENTRPLPVRPPRPSSSSSHSLPLPTSVRGLLPAFSSSASASPPPARPSASGTEGGDDGTREHLLPGFALALSSSSSRKRTSLDGELEGEGEGEEGRKRKREVDGESVL